MATTAKHRQYAWSANRVSLGLCGRCGKPLGRGTRNCDRCLDYFSIWRADKKIDRYREELSNLARR